MSNEPRVHAPRCSRFQLSVRFLVLLMILEAAALVLQNTRSFKFMEQLQLLEHIPWFAGRRPDLAINVTGRVLDHARPRSPIGAYVSVNPDTTAADNSLCIQTLRQQTDLSSSRHYGSRQISLHPDTTAADKSQFVQTLRQQTNHSHAGPHQQYEGRCKATGGKEIHSPVALDRFDKSSR